MSKETYVHKKKPVIDMSNETLMHEIKPEKETCAYYGVATISRLLKITGLFCRI